MRPADTVEQPYCWALAFRTNAHTKRPEQIATHLQIIVVFIVFPLVLSSKNGHAHAKHLLLFAPMLSVAIVD
jgi:hypothetical protein